MLPNIQGLVNNIIQSVSDFLSPRDPGEKLYPKDAEISKVLGQIEKSNWSKSMPYVFAVRDLSNPNAPAGAGPFADFELPINPSELSQDEPFAIVIRPSQGGTVVSHSGVRYADLVISGTTGVHPFRGTGGADASGQAILQPNDLKHQSGYYVFLQLRNWFRAYYQYKFTNKEQAKNLRLVFKNFKDGEFLIVELLRFSMKRNAQRPMMYDYTLPLRVIGRLQQPPATRETSIDSILNDALDKINTARGVFLRSQDLIRQVEGNVEAVVVEPLRRLNLAIGALLAIPKVAADMGSRLIQRFTTAAVALAVLLHIKISLTQANKGASSASGASVSQISNSSQAGKTLQVSPSSPFEGVVLPDNLEAAVQANPAAVILGLKDALLKVPVSLFPVAAIDELAQEQLTAANLPRKYFEDVLSDLIRVRDNAADKYNLTNSTYNSHFSRTVTEVPESDKQVSDEEFEVLGAFNLAIKAIFSLLRTEALFNTTYQERISEIQKDFDGQLRIITSAAVREVRMPVGITLERLAQQELQDSQRWPEIVALNDLKPPFVVQDLSDVTPNVLHPGDRVLIPAPVVNGFGNATTLRESAVNQGLSQAERSLGIDLALTPSFDLKLTNRNDISIVRGAQNAAQAILLKLFYERGDLLNHPEIGVGLQIGSKGDAISEIKTNIITSLTSDPRFESIQNLSLKRTNGSLTIEFTAFVKNVDIPVPLTLTL